MNHFHACKLLLYKANKIVNKKGKYGGFLSKEGMIDGCLTEGEEIVDDKQLNQLQELQSEALSSLSIKPGTGAK